MSTLKELLNKHCPNGVEYKQIKDIAKINRGIIISKKYIEENKGDYPVYSSQTENNGELGRINNYAYDGEYLTWTTDGANAGSVFYRNEKFNITNVCGLIKITESNVITKFVYYILRIYAPKYVNRGMGNCKLMSNVMESIKIPIPPIEVQKEIVRILDIFTKYQDLLNRELELRKKQYEYYRDKLLTFGDDIERKSIGELSNIVRGASPRPIKNFITDAPDGINWIKIGDIDIGSKYVTSTKEKITLEGAKKSRFVKKGDFILSNSMSFGRPYILKIDGCIHDGWLSISNFEDKLLPDFLYYLLSSTQLQNEMKKKASFGGAVENLKSDTVREIKIPVPPLEEQERIVNILDKFDALCNDITKGLPAEIELRKKQYEYYRDKLLTFKEKKK